MTAARRAAKMKRYQQSPGVLTAAGGAVLTNESRVPSRLFYFSWSTIRLSRFRFIQSKTFQRKSRTVANAAKAMRACWISIGVHSFRERRPRADSAGTGCDSIKWGMGCLHPISAVGSGTWRLGRLPSNVTHSFLWMFAPFNAV